MPGLAAGQHTVEEIHPVLDAEDQVLRRAHPHEVAGPVGGQLPDELRQQGIHLGLGLTHAEAAHGEALEGGPGIQLQGLGQVPAAQVQVGPPLVDGEEGLVVL